MRTRDALACVVVLGLMTSACSKFTFVRQDAGRKSYRQVAPEYTFRKDAKRDGQLAASDRLVLASQSLAARDIDAAERHANAALKANPQSVDAYGVLALIASQRGQDALAGKYYGKAAELAPDQGPVLNNYGAWLCSNGRTVESLSWFDRALADTRYGSIPAARANAGACALQAGQAERAERDLRAALRDVPGNPVALAAMAKLEFDHGRYLQARAFAERRLAAAQPDASILGLATQIEIKLGDLAAADRYTQQLAALGQGVPAQTAVPENK